MFSVFFEYKVKKHNLFEIEIFCKCLCHFQIDVIHSWLKEVVMWSCSCGFDRGAVLCFLRYDVQEGCRSGGLDSSGSGSPDAAQTVSLQIHRAVPGSDWTVYSFHNGAVHQVPHFSMR